MARFLPNGEDDESPFIGMEATSNNAPENARTDVSARTRQLEAQRADAESRHVVWTAENERVTDEDAEGEEQT